MKINNMIKKIILSFLITTFLLISAPTVQASVPCPYPGCFGGVARSEIFCTCSDNFLVYFTPLYFYGSPAPLAGPLTFQPGTMKYLNYSILPTEAVIGSYVPGVQACWMDVGPTCVPVPNYGLILPDTGSSLPGGGNIGLGAGAVGTAIGAGVVAGVGGLANNGQNGSSAHTQPATYSSRIIISKGGTYSGNWASNDARFPAVDIQTSQPVTITNSNIRSKGALVNAVGVDANITITNTYGYGENPDLDMKVPGRFLFVQGFNKVAVQNNYLENTRGIQIQGPKSGAGSIKITDNQIKNIDGRLSGGPGIWRGEDIERYAQSNTLDVGGSYGQFVQLNGVTNARVEIGWNQVINDPYVSRSEDVISIYKSSGTSAYPIDIHDNYIQGSYPVNPTRDTFSGGGIMSGDDVGSGNVLVENNTVVATTNYGISASAGSNIHINGNRIISSSKLPNGSSIKYNSSGGNVGLAIFNGYNSSLSNVTASDNVVGWTMANSQRNDWYIPEASSFTGNTHFRAGAMITTDMENNELASWRKKMTDNSIQIGPSN